MIIKKDKKMNVFNTLVVFLLFFLNAQANALNCDLQFSNHVCAGLNWVEGPWKNINGKMISKLELYFWDQNTSSPSGPYLNLSTIPIVEPLMDMDMDYTKASVIQKSDGKQGYLTGVYEVTDLNFSMGGQWYLKITLNKEPQKSVYFNVKKRP